MPDEVSTQFSRMHVNNMMSNFSGVLKLQYSTIKSGGRRGWHRFLKMMH